MTGGGGGGGHLPSSFILATPLVEITQTIGQTRMQSVSRVRGISVPRARVRDLLRALDLSGTALRWIFQINTMSSLCC